MISTTPARWPLLMATVLAVACVAVHADSTGPSDDPSALRTIVLQCLDAAVPDYCTRCPEPLEGTCGVTSCWNGTDVWAETDRFVAIRDRKMCHCPPEFVHGLALPRALVTGVEDPRRPDGIWPFAWDVAVTRIAVGAEIGLAVNPPFARTQDQLHVHIVRLRDDARARIEALSPVHIENLDRAWQAAAAHAQRRGYASYGVAVVQAAGRGYLVVSTDVSPEYAFTQSTCTGTGFTSSR